MVAVDPRTPVIVGAAAITARHDDPAAALEASSLMAAALESATDGDAATLGLARAADWVMVPKGSWRYRNAAALVAAAFGATGARTLVADLGILQTTLFSRAAKLIARGEARVVLVAGGEARWREVRAKSAGVPAADTDDSAGPPPDAFVQPDGLIISRAEIDAGLIMAAGHYALIENARRVADGQTLAEHTATIAAQAERFSAVAAHNPDAWNRRPMKATAIAKAGPDNAPQAVPYNKWHVSQWNVDQAAGFVMCSYEAAVGAGISRDRMVFPHAIVESNAMVPVSERAEITRSPGFALAGARAAALAHVELAAIPHVDLYSCFPIAVRTQVRELGLDPDRPLTITGGMTFAGGPLNNYALQALAAMVDVLRAHPGARGLVTAISGMITKQGVSVWSTDPPPRPDVTADVSAEASAATTRRPFVTGEDTPATVTTSTVVFERGVPARGVVIADRPDGARTLAITTDTDLMHAMANEEWHGRRMRVAADQTFSA